MAGVYALAAPPLSGAIFTTTVDGTIVNENVHYQKKEDVYLDGGPGPNAPSSAAGLPEGVYYFQVTDPSGKDLLSTDHISCRMIHVNEDGVISFVYTGTNYVWKQGAYVAVSCKHEQGVDEDHHDVGAITVQLYPYDDTPNPGGVYKVWITPVDDYAGKWGDDYVPSKKDKIPVNGEYWQPANVHGFIPSKSKTDNYKVKKRGKPFTAPEITVRKFHDKDLDGVQDSGEEEVTGWEVTVEDPLGIENTVYTPATIVAALAGEYCLEEEVPEGVLQTVAYLDGNVDSAYSSADPMVCVDVAGDDEETHEVVYGNVGLGSATACKVFDRDGDGVRDDGEPLVVGWKFQLTGTDVLGNTVGPIVGFTGENGCVTFSDLLPGSYTIMELFPTGDHWEATGDTSVSFNIVSTLSGSVISGTAAEFAFTNICFGSADFGTKGYWHNKNGLTEIDEDFVFDVVNHLDPYDSPSDYFGDGDEPFDGEFEDGTDVAEAFNDQDSVAPAGTWQAEVSHFLVDANAGGDPREQLAQQLLAFIFNVEYRLGSTDAIIVLDDGTTVVAGDLIDEAIAAWGGESGSEQVAIKDVLDGLNNDDDVKFVPTTPCPVNY